MATQEAIDTVLASYAAMGRPGMSPDDPDIQSWANQNATPQQIWQAAASYRGDPVFGEIAENAWNLLMGPIIAAQQAQAQAAAAGATPAQATAAGNEAAAIRQDEIVTVALNTGQVPIAPIVSGPAVESQGVSIIDTVSNAVRTMTPMQMAMAALVALFVLRR